MKRRKIEWWWVLSLFQLWREVKQRVERSARLGQVDILSNIWNISQICLLWNIYSAQFQIFHWNNSTLKTPQSSYQNTQMENSNQNWILIHDLNLSYLNNTKIKRYQMVWHRGGFPYQNYLSTMKANLKSNLSVREAVKKKWYLLVIFPS